MTNKPPLGVMQEQFYEVHRIQDLSRAIYEYCVYKSSERDFSEIESLITWIDELKRRLIENNQLS